MGAIREVRKRDNRVVPFDESKIADAIYKAIRSVGRGDRPLAEELAAAVTHFLEKKFAGRIPGIEDIQDQVETVLIETGHAEIAKAYILYRNKRAAVRETLQVRRDDPVGSAGAAGGGPELVEDRGGVAPWSKRKIAAALIREADMAAAAAEEVAAAVERRVFASGIRRISTSLIRELVDNELFERGFGPKLKRQAPIGLPKYNLEQIIFGTDSKEGFTFPKTPVEVQDLIAAQILKQYALGEVFSPAVADAHREGRLHLHALGSPIRFERLRWCWASGRGDRLPGQGDPGAVAAPRGGDEDLDGGEFFRRLARLVHFVAGEIALSNPHFLLSCRSFPGADERGRVEGVFARLEEIQAGPPRASLALDLDLGRSALPWLSSIADRPPARRPGLRLRLAGSGEPPSRQVLEVAAALFERGEPIEFLPPGGPLGPDAERGLTPVAGRITINLPRAAFRSGTDRRRSIEQEIEEVLDLAVRGHLERRRFIERLGANRENPLWDILTRADDSPRPHRSDLRAIEFPVAVLGLNECAKFLTGYELHQDPRALQAGREIVQQAARKLERDARGLGLKLVLCESQNSGSLRRLEELDRERYPESVEVDHGRGPPGGGPRYADGVRLHRRSPVDPLRRIEHLAGFLDLVAPAGLLDDSPELVSGGGELVLSLLEECLPLLAAGGGARGAAAGLPAGAGPGGARRGR